MGGPSEELAPGMQEVTRILTAIHQGDALAADELFSLVYQELRVLAAQKFARETPGQTLQATALVHEAYLRLVGDDCPHWQNRAHFFGAAAEAMRRILIENARRKQRQKHGGKHLRVELHDQQAPADDSVEDILALNEAFEQLSREEPKVAEVVKLKYFAGLSLDQISDVLDVSRRTVNRHWAFAKAWLLNELEERAESPA